MFKAMIAEDEQAERESLVALLEKEFADLLKLEYAAPNGLFALKYLFSHQVDILFLDIRMPVMSGIEIMQELRSSNHPTEIIIVSAYSDFEYAQKALAGGAVDYLLKPYTLKDLRRSVARAAEKLARRDQVDLDRKKLDEQRERLRSMIDRDIISSVFYSNSLPSEEEFDQLVALLDLPSRLWMLTVFRFPEDDSSLADPEWEKLLGFYRRRRKESVVHGIGRELIALEFLDGGRPDPRLQFFPDQLRRFCREELGRDVRHSVSAMHEGSAPLTAAYDEVHQAQSGARAVALRGSTDFAARMAREAAGSLASMDGTRLEEVVRSVSDTLEESGAEERGEYLSSIILLLQGELYRRLPSEAAAAGDAALGALRREQMTGDLSDLHRFSSGLRALFSRLQSRLGGSKELVAGRVDAYIREHPDQELNIRVLAQVEGISPSHLSRLFKEVTGSTVNQRIIDVRLQRGDELLRGGGLSVKEAAFRVGFRDPNYFSKLYKRQFGRAPTG